MKTIKTKGFTLIELMITVAIVGILAAVALPAYQDYTIRAQTTEGMSLISGQKVAVSEYYQNHGNFPQASQIGFNGSTGKYVSLTNIGVDGRIESTFGGDSVNSNLSGRKILLLPKENNEGSLEWNCHSNAPSKYLPSSCTSSIPPFSADANIGIYRYQEGILNINNFNDIRLLSTEADGTQVFGGSNGIGMRNATFRMDTNGTITRLDNGTRPASKTYTQQSGGGSISYQQASDGQTIPFFNMMNSSSYPTTAFSTYSVYSQAVTDYRAGRIPRTQYEQATTNYKNEIKEVATSNHGGPPAGFPQIYLDFMQE